MQKKWQYDEKAMPGTDYNDEKEAVNYDGRMSGIRDIQAENQAIADWLKITGSDTVLEIGCGTGGFAIGISQQCLKVIAVDVSEAMLSLAKRQAAESGAANAEFINSGFLDIDIIKDPVDHVVTQFALHHLPDFWKMIALKKINSVLKPGGKFFLKDIVFSLNPDKYDKTIDYTLKHLKEIGGDVIAEEFEKHVKEEFSTYDWIIEEMLYRAGLDIIDADYGDNLVTTYVCVKSDEKR